MKGPLLALIMTLNVLAGVTLAAPSRPNETIVETYLLYDDETYFRMGVVGQVYDAYMPKHTIVRSIKNYDGDQIRSEKYCLIFPNNTYDKINHTYGLIYRTSTKSGSLNRSEAQSFQYLLGEFLYFLGEDERLERSARSSNTYSYFLDDLRPRGDARNSYQNLIRLINSVCN